MIKDAELRSKAQLIDGFILQNVDNDKDNFLSERKRADGSSDLEERLNQYIRGEKKKAIEKVATEEELPVEVLDRYLAEYDFSLKEQTEIIQDALKEKHLGLVKGAPLKTASWNFPLIKSPSISRPPMCGKKGRRSTCR